VVGDVAGDQHRVDGAAQPPQVPDDPLDASAAAPAVVHVEVRVADVRDEGHPCDGTTRTSAASSANPDPAAHADRFSPLARRKFPGNAQT
jgi:hypothetical protein